MVNRVSLRLLRLVIWREWSLRTVALFSLIHYNLISFKTLMNAEKTQQAVHQTQSAPIPLVRSTVTAPKDTTKQKTINVST